MTTTIPFDFARYTTADNAEAAAAVIAEYQEALAGWGRTDDDEVQPYYEGQVEAYVSVLTAMLGVPKDDWTAYASRDNTVPEESVLWTRSRLVRLVETYRVSLPAADARAAIADPDAATDRYVDGFGEKVAERVERLDSGEDDLLLTAAIEED